MTTHAHPSWGARAESSCFACGGARSRDSGARAVLLEDRGGERLAVIVCGRCRDTPTATLWLRWRIVHVDA